MDKVTDTLQDQIRRFMVVCSVLIGVLIIVVAVSAVMIVSGIIQPISQLNQATEKIAQGDFNARAQADSEDEVAELAVSFNKMAGSMQSLIDKVKEDERKMRKADLRLLQEQIQPHFLYNTLDIVVWMIEENRKEDAAGMVTALARFLRISLSKGKNIITVADELEHARNYLMIQSLRAKDQFTYRIEKDPGTECFQVIKLIVQPIVENALYHGLEGMYGDGEIVIHAYTKDGDLYISVKDNGMGMSKEQAEALLDYTKELKTAKGNGIGVRNVHERIQLHFGKEYGVQIISEEDEGTEILLHLPAIMYGEKKE